MGVKYFKLKECGSYSENAHNIHFLKFRVSLKVKQQVTAKGYVTFQKRNEAEAIYKRRWSMNNNMRRVKGKGSGKSFHKTPNMLNKSHMNDKFFHCKVSKTYQMISKANNWKPWITTDLVRVLQCELCTKVNLQH